MFWPKRWLNKNAYPYGTFYVGSIEIKGQPYNRWQQFVLRKKTACYLIF